LSLCYDGIIVFELFFGVFLRFSVQYIGILFFGITTRPLTNKFQHTPLEVLRGRISPLEPLGLVHLESSPSCGRGRGRVGKGEKGEGKVFNRSSVQRSRGSSHRTGSRSSRSHGGPVRAQWRRRDGGGWRQGRRCRSGRRGLTRWSSGKRRDPPRHQPQPQPHASCGQG